MARKTSKQMLRVPGGLFAIVAKVTCGLGRPIDEQVTAQDIVDALEQLLQVGNTLRLDELPEQSVGGSTELWLLTELTKHGNTAKVQIRMIMNKSVGDDADVRVDSVAGDTVVSAISAILNRNVRERMPPREVAA